MNKYLGNAKNNTLYLRVIIAYSIVVTLLLVAFVTLAYINLSQPIARYATGGCILSNVRYSVVGKEFDKFSKGYVQAKVDREIEKRREEQNRAIGIAEGCSVGEMHELYYW